LALSIIPVSSPRNMVTLVTQNSLFLPRDGRERRRYSSRLPTEDDH